MRYELLSFDPYVLRMGKKKNERLMGVKVYLHIKTYKKVHLFLIFLSVLKNKKMGIQHSSRSKFFLFDQTINLNIISLKKFLSMIKQQIHFLVQCKF